jgi:hypothetical protein
VQGVEAVIRPEPTTEERDAIIAALAREKDDAPDPRGAWWRLGVQEALADGLAPSESGL